MNMVFTFYWILWLPVIVSFQDSISWVNICSMALFEILLFQHKCPLLGEKYSWSLLSDREFEGCLPHLTILFCWFAARPPPLDLRGLSTIRECPTHMPLIRTMTEPGWDRNLLSSSWTLSSLSVQILKWKKSRIYLCVFVCVVPSNSLQGKLGIKGDQEASIPIVKLPSILTLKIVIHA